MTNTPHEKVRLSSYQQVGFVLGIIVASLNNNFADVVQGTFHLSDRNTALQVTIGIMCVLAAAIVAFPVAAIDEKKIFCQQTLSFAPVARNPSDLCQCQFQILPDLRLFLLYGP